GRMLETTTFSLESGRLHYFLRGKVRVYAAVDSHIMVAGPLHGILVAGFDGGADGRWVTHDLAAYAGPRLHIEFCPDGDSPLDILMVVESETKPTWSPIHFALPQSWSGSVNEMASNLQARFAEAARLLGDDNLPGHPELAPLADWLVQHRRLLGVDDA